jgi:hypothetical protein
MLAQPLSVNTATAAAANAHCKGTRSLVTLLMIAPVDYWLL